LGRGSAAGAGGRRRDGRPGPGGPRLGAARPVTPSACRGAGPAAKMPPASRGGDAMPMPSTLRALRAILAVAGLLACRPAPGEPEAPASSDLSRPALAVQALTGHMRSGDFAAFARDAVPPVLHGRLEAAWR